MTFNFSFYYLQFLFYAISSCVGLPYTFFLLTFLSRFPVSVASWTFFPRTSHNTAWWYFLNWSSIAILVRWLSRLAFIYCCYHFYFFLPLFLFAAILPVHSCSFFGLPWFRVWVILVVFSSDLCCCCFPPIRCLSYNARALTIPPNMISTSTAVRPFALLSPKVDLS